MSGETHRVCGRCRGTGFAPLSKQLRATLDACVKLDAEGASICARHVGNMLRPRPNPSALSNRLRALEVIGYLSESFRSQSIHYVLRKR